MAKNFFHYRDSKTRKWVFFLSLFIATFWSTGLFINIYRFAPAGALFEILWFPVVALTVILPIISFVFWVRERFIFRSAYLASFILLMATLFVIAVYSK